jgi:hypothetical protein
MKSLFFLFFLSTLLCRGELVFVAERLEVKAGPLEEEAKAVFTFRNSGTESVMIQHVESTCDCLSAEANLAEIPAGQEGQITATYRIENLTGKAEKALILHSSDKARPQIRLAMALEVTTLCMLEPKMLEWIVGEAAAPREAVFSVQGEQPIVIRQVTSTKPEYQVRLIEVEAGRKYRIQVIPPEKPTPTVGAIKILTDHPHAKYQRQMLFFSVNHPPAPAVQP